jgi:bacterioferritin-associated ferredoxin
VLCGGFRRGSGAQGRCEVVGLPAPGAVPHTASHSAPQTGASPHSTYTQKLRISSGEPCPCNGVRKRSLLTGASLHSTYTQKLRISSGEPCPCNGVRKRSLQTGASPHSTYTQKLRISSEEPCLCNGVRKRPLSGPPNCSLGVLGGKSPDTHI